MCYCSDVHEWTTLFFLFIFTAFPAEKRYVPTSCPSSLDLGHLTWYIRCDVDASAATRALRAVPTPEPADRDLKMWLLVLLAWSAVWIGATYWYLFGKRNPFSLESLRPPAPREFDQKKRDKVLKQGKTTECVFVCVISRFLIKDLMKHFNRYRHITAKSILNGANLTCEVVIVWLS